MSINDLPPAEFDMAVIGFATAFLLIAHHVLDDPAYALAARTTRALRNCLARRELPEDLATIGRMADFVLTQTYWDSQRRELTESEITVRAAAARLSRAVQATRHHEGDHL
jgi:hypothetical protein